MPNDRLKLPDPLPRPARPSTPEESRRVEEALRLYELMRRRRSATHRPPPALSAPPTPAERTEQLARAAERRHRLTEVSQALRSTPQVRLAAARLVPAIPLTAAHPIQAGALFEEFQAHARQTARLLAPWLTETDIGVVVSEAGYVAIHDAAQARGLDEDEADDWLRMAETELYGSPE